MTQSATTAPAGGSGGRKPGGVHSLERGFLILESMADAGGSATLTGLAHDVGLPTPTIHRIVRTLVNLGYVRQEQSRQYTLGPRLVRLGDASAAKLGTWALPYLSDLANDLGESSNLAMLDGNEIVYLGQKQGRHSMRMFTEVGRRVSPHCTAVGKALLARKSPAEVDSLLSRMDLTRFTPNTITDRTGFLEALQQIRASGYALDEGEQEIGVRCVAVAVPTELAPLAISVSGPSARITDTLVQRAVPLLQETARRLSIDLSRNSDPADGS